MPAIQWNTELYDNKHAFVSKYGEELIGWLHPQPGEHILDLGCGTGQLARIIAGSGAFVIGMDSSPEMIAQAKANYPHIRFDVKDAADFSYNEPFDAIFSNATLHWVSEAGKAVSCMYRNLKPGGRIALEFGGKGNVKLITNAVQTVMQQEGLADKITNDFWYFPSVSEYTTLLKKHGFRVSAAILFDRPTPLNGEDGMENWLNMFGDFFFRLLTDEEKENVIRKTVAYLRPVSYREGSWYGDYKRIRIRAIK